MRLNLGCGRDVRDGYINVDFRPLHPSVVNVDLSKLPWPWPDSEAKEIMMLDFLEHFPYVQTQPILLECYRILSDDGELVVQVPDGTHIANALSMQGEYLCNRCGGEMSGQSRNCPKCGQATADIAEAAMRRLYGGQDHPGNFHHTCFTQSSLTSKAKDCGLELVRYEEERHQFLNWNFCARFRKGKIW